MTIRAKYAGRCAACGGAIQIGAEIEWSRGGPPPRHTRCSQPPHDPETLLAMSGRHWAADATESFRRSGRQGPALGEVVTVKARHYLVVARGEAYYHSEDDCEDNDCFCGRYGWITPYRARQVTESPDEGAAREARDLAAREETARAARLTADLARLRTPEPGWVFYDGATVGGEWRVGEAVGVERPVAVPPRAEWVTVDETEPDPTPLREYARLYQTGEFRVLEHGNYDDWRTALLIPPHLVDAYFAAEAARLRVTADAARAWLANYRGCVGSPLYEWVAAHGDAAWAEAAGATRCSARRVST